MSENVTAYAPYDSEGKRMPLACPVEYLYDENGYGAGERRFASGEQGAKTDTLATGAVYSTKEVKTGETWIDGRPIYRKVFTFELPEISSGNTSARFNLDTDIDPGAIIDLTARFNQNGKTNYGVPMGADFVNPAFSTFVFWSSAVAKRLLIDYGSGVSKQPALAIIKYTKSTDQATAEQGANENA